jgi:poly(3-hydroxybutyrate) depolymerase
MRAVIGKAAAAIICSLALLMVAGCGPDYPRLRPGEVRAFKVPLTSSGQPADSTLCLFSVPAGYTPDESFPLIVALHGGGSSAARFHELWRPVTQASGIVLATPQGEQSGPDGIGYRWGPEGETTVRRSIDAILRKVKVDRRKVYLAGFSQGGHLAYALAWSYPDAFAGVAGLGVGYDLPDPAAAGAPQDMRIYIGHGEREPGLEDVRGFAQGLRDRGCEVEHSVYEGMGHGLPRPISAELERILNFLAGDD